MLTTTLPPLPDGVTLLCVGPQDKLVPARLPAEDEVWPPLAPNASQARNKAVQSRSGLFDDPKPVPVATKLKPPRKHPGVVTPKAPDRKPADMTRHFLTGLAGPVGKGVKVVLQVHDLVADEELAAVRILLGQMGYRRVEVTGVPR